MGRGGGDSLGNKFTFYFPKPKLIKHSDHAKTSAFLDHSNTVTAGSNPALDVDFSMFMC
jgi:hypothetical protein